MITTLDAALIEAEEIISDVEKLVRVVLSGSRKYVHPSSVRVEIRPVLLKDRLVFQIVENDGRQTRTKNQDLSELKVGALLRSGFSSVHIDQVEASLSVQITKKDGAIIHREKRINSRALDHDKQKRRLLEPSDPYLKEVGISDFNGNIKPSRQDKYRQVEEFLRLLVPTVNSAIESGHLTRPSFENPLQVVDLGCGNAYLTFAVHQYFQSESIPIRVTGIDIREESRVRNSAIAERIGAATSMNFVAAQISESRVDKVDIVIALHACDTATDDAIAWSVENDTKILLIAPCCHHDIQSQLKDIPEPWKMVTKHGLLKERFADILTDSIRSQILRLVGYRSEIIEFVGDEHTPRNLLIRAVKTGSRPSMQDKKEYEDMVSLWRVKPVLARRLENYLNVERGDL